MSLLIQNTILKQAENKIESQLSADVREAYMRIVVAGMKLAMNNGPNSIMASIQSSKDPLHDIVQGAIGIIGILREHSKGVMPAKAMVPAGFTLMVHGLDFAAHAGILQVDVSVLDQATQSYAEGIMRAMKISPQMLQELASQVHGVMQDPQKMQHLRTVSMQGAQNGAA